MFEGHPKGLFALALSNTGERFGYYTMIAVFTLFLHDNFGWDEGTAGTVYSSFLMLVYFLPIAGGALADKIGFNMCVTIGFIVMALGYLLLSIPAGATTAGIVMMGAALLLISVGTSLFKGNLQVMVGNLYDAPDMQPKRDAAFSIFYMAINVGALFAPTAAIDAMDYAQTHLGASLASSYHYAFAIACIAHIVSMAVYYGFKGTFSTVAADRKKTAAGDGNATTAAPQEALSPQETKERLVALFLVFAVVIFFWMAFHQNGSTLTFFARDFTAQHSYGIESMMFDVTNLVALIFIVYALFALVQAKTTKGKGAAVAVIAAAAAFLVFKYVSLPDDGTEVLAPIFQQFNPCFVVALTPVSMALFAWLASKGKEPSAPRKIGLGMLVAGLGFVIMVCASVGLDYDGGQRVAPGWLVATYLVLTFAELLLSPMGISFVSKVAPPKYKGLMMGCWFGATAVGNQLVMIPAWLWGNVPLTAVWGVLVVLCLLSFVFIFSIMKRLEMVC